MKSNKIFSFDIFDTVFTRIVKNPTDIFYLMQIEINRHYYNLPKEFYNQFFKIRINEASAKRKESNKEEIEFQSIYSHIGQKYSLSESMVIELMNLESELEYHSIIPIDKTISEINTLRLQGEKIIFISDMYLPKPQIIKMLEKVNAYCSHDNVYVSGEVGLTKHTGKLFKYVMEKENCSPNDFFHYGDNIASDVITPFRLGINIYGKSRKTVQRMIIKYKAELYYKKIRRIISALFHGNFNKS
jgi:predicted HAD superfamily hydrolase